MDGSILPEGGSGETKSPQHTVELMVLLDFPDSQGPATHCKYNIVSLQKRNYYKHFVLWVGRKSAPYHGHCKTDRPLGLYGPKTGNYTIY